MKTFSPARFIKTAKKTSVDLTCASELFRSEESAHEMRPEEIRSNWTLEEIGQSENRAGPPETPKKS